MALTEAEMYEHRERALPNRVYVASSWRNPIQIAVCAALRAAKIDYYDFRNPGDDLAGFSWKEVMPSFDIDAQECTADDYLDGLAHPRAEQGFAADFAAMKDCDTCVLVLPCGKSAHLELGWFIGQGKRTAILLDGSKDTVQPELMYKLADYVAPSLFDLLGWLGVED